ncbi:hypothetical protein D3C80_1333320 [compost metagenome]
MLVRARVLIITDARASKPFCESALINSSKSSSSGRPACCSAPIRLAQNDSSFASSCDSDSHTTTLPSLSRLWRHWASKVVLPKPALPLISVRRQLCAASSRDSSGVRRTAWLLIRGGEKRVVINGRVAGMGIQSTAVLVMDGWGGAIPP